MELIITTKEHDPNTMFLRQDLAHGTDEETGTEVVLAFSASALVFTLQHKREGGEPFGTGRIVHTVSFKELLQAWTSQLPVDQQSSATTTVREEIG